MQWGSIIIPGKIIGLVAFLGLFSIALKKTEQRGFLFWQPWLLALALAIVFLIFGVHSNVADTNKTSFRVYIANGSVGTPDMVSDSQMLTQDKTTVMLLPARRNITLKLVSAKKMMIRTMVVNFYFDLPDLRDIEPVGTGWMPAQPESSVNQMTEKPYPDLSTTHWVWCSQNIYYSETPYCVNSLMVATNVPNGTLKARVEVFSEKSDTQSFPVEFQINQ